MHSFHMADHWKPTLKFRYLIFNRHFHKAMSQAKIIYTQDHSNNATGFENKDIPQWVRSFYPVFAAEQNNPTRHVQAVRARAERRQVVASISGRQATLGHRTNDPSEMRHETSPNDGDPGMEQQIIGNVGAERIADTSGRDSSASAGEVAWDPNDPMDSDLTEGVDDMVEQRRSAPQGQSRANGTRRQNTHVGNSTNFTASGNDPSARFAMIRDGYRSLNTLGAAITNRISAPPVVPAPPPPPPCLTVTIVQDYMEVKNTLAM